ncbi:Glycosyltransferase involved in cell wall bisynthesis [Enhydrobacter aerosaccus]|uniref:Glycosyltransferase involved in cell wall bisynthesis n=1 Tax=Enhydrobacter aerosaccus TaxID=225324 RepID=A0A1T4SCJ5_9HYPH|nr:glycosyltransferase family 1 protein [Enhydrobacter aerosaccus]SKA25953.1 Glycosyltransferase involved in cell wall bisynthesis [Enhydrobacter aerosaccus]
MSGRLLFDLTGLLHWYAYFKRPGGVQRVIEKIAASDAIRQSGKVEFVARLLGDNRFVQIDPSAIGNIPALRRLHSAALRHASFAGAFREGQYFHIPYLALGYVPGRRSSLQIVEPPARGDSLFNPGDLWWQKAYAPIVADLKTRTGLRIVQQVHDLYLIERPEWTPAHAVRAFSRQLVQIAPAVDHWLVLSQFTKKRLRRILAERGLPERPISIMPVGWDSFPGNSPHRPAIVEGPYIMFVGTVEPRKNLPALLDAIETLRAQLGARVPQLVVVGGKGWKAGDVEARLARAAREGKVIWFRNVSDTDLGALYSRARFTVMPSHGEGWGLAVQESISQGVPCIAADVGATRESGGDLAVYFDPARPEALTRAMSAWITDEASLARAARRIATALATPKAFPTWNDAGKAILEVADLGSS